MSTPKNNYLDSDSIESDIEESNQNLLTAFINNISSKRSPRMMIQTNETNTENQNNNQINTLREQNTTQKTKILSQLPKLGEVKITNVVSMFYVGCNLNLKEIAKKLNEKGNYNFEYNSKKFNALKLRLKEPKTIALIFDSGRIVVTGAKNEEDSKKAAKEFTKIVRSTGYEVKFKDKDFSITNMSGTYNLGFNIRLNKLCVNLCKKFKITNPKEERNKVHYEPEKYCGLTYKIKNPKLTALIYATGRINFVGAKNKEDFKLGLEAIYPDVVEYKNENIKKIKK